MRGAIGRAATGGGSAALRIAHTPPRRYSYVENPLNRGLQPSCLSLLPLLALCPLHPLASSSPRRPRRPPSRAFALSSSFFARVPFARFIRSLPPPTLFLPSMCVFYPSSSSSSPSPSSSSFCAFSGSFSSASSFPPGGNKLGRLAKIVFFDFQDETSKTISRTLSGRRWWHRSSIGL